MQRKLEIEQVIADLHAAFPATRFTLKASDWFGSSAFVTIKWDGDPPEAAVETVVNERGGVWLIMQRSDASSSRCTATKGTSAEDLA